MSRAYVHGYDERESVRLQDQASSVLDLLHSDTRYPAGSSVHGVDERIYEVDDTADPPLLILTINRGEPQAFAAGMSDLQFSYVLHRNCPTCDVVDLPATTAEWWLVNAVEVTATMETVGGTQPEDEATIVASSVGKPRNLLP